MNDPGIVSRLGLDGDDLEHSVNDLLSDSERMEAALSLTGDAACAFLDILLKIVDETPHQSLALMCRKCSRKLSERSGMRPRSLAVVGIQRVGYYPVTGCGCADIWQGTYQDQTVALKVLRIFATQHLFSKLQKEFCREALVWRQIKHRNITPFIGVSFEPFLPHMCMVSLWMSNGNILQFLDTNPNRNRVELLHGIAEGLDYIHSTDPVIVHGDVRGANILISEDLRPMLSDFAPTSVADTQGAAYGTGSLLKGSTRWMAPELFNPDLFGGTAPQRSPQTDIYAFACLCIEVYSNKVPFPDSNESTAIVQVLRGNRPDLPRGSVPMPRNLWALVGSCWTHEPSERPIADQIVQNLGRMHNELPTFLQRSLLEARLSLGIPSPLAAEGVTIWSIAFSPDCKLIASGSIDGIIRVWDTETNESWELTGHSARVTVLSFSHDGKSIVSGADTTVCIWQAETGVYCQLTGHTHLVRSAAFSRDDKFVASGATDGTLRLWDVKAGMSQELKRHFDSVAAVAFSPDGKHLASGSYDTTVCIWDLSNGVSRLFSGHSSWVQCTAWAPDSKHVASGSKDHTIRLWNVDTGVSQVFAGHANTVLSLAFSLDGEHIVSGSWDETVRVLDARSGSTVCGPFIGHNHVVCCVQFSPEGGYVISAAWDGTVRAWNV